MLWSTSLVDGLMARYFDGTAHVRGLLGDQAWSAWAALAAFSATGDVKWLARAQALVDGSDVLFDPAAGAYRDRAPHAVDAGRLNEPIFPMPENALMARSLLALGAFTGDERFAERARLVLDHFAPSYQKMGAFAAPYASAVLDAIEPPYDVKLVGEPSSPTTRDLRDRLLDIASPPLRINVVDPHDEARMRAAALEPAAEPTAFVCRGTTCFARATSVDNVLAAIGRINSTAT